MDARHSTEMFKHLEKQGEVLMEAYRAMSHELHGLQVEEEMLMHKLYELMSAEGLIKKIYPETRFAMHKFHVAKTMKGNEGESNTRKSESLSPHAP